MAIIIVKLDKCSEDVLLRINYNYTYDPEISTYANGDPGEPAYESVEIETAFTSMDILQIFDVYTYTELHDEIARKISEYERNSE